jgi:hypothetical protein
MFGYLYLDPMIRLLIVLGYLAHPTDGFQLAPRGGISLASHERNRNGFGVLDRISLRSATAMGFECFKNKWPP